MKHLKRTLSLLMVLGMLVSLLAVLPAASAATFSYNTGTRGVTCTSLSAKATAYYTGTYTYANLKTQTASNLKSKLATLMTNTHTTKTTYANLTTYSKYSDATSGSSSKLTLFYTSKSVSSSWDSGSTWNREHVWPQSLGSFTTTNCGADMHHVRPADPKVNSTRGNLPYGYVRGGSYSTATTSSGTVGGYYNSSYFEPLDSVKGDVARILLYCYVRWGESNLTDVIQNVDLLLSWCQADPVDTWEMGRNDVVQGIQGNRNVFIDYPEYAWLIFGRTVPSNMTTPSGMAASGGSSGGSSGGGSSSGTTASLVTTAPSDWSGNYVLVGVKGSTYYVLDASGSVTGTNLGSSSGAKTLSAAGITRSGNTLSGVSNSYVYTVAKTGSYYYFKMKGSSNYLTYKSKGLTTSTSYSGTAAQWTLSLSSGAVRMRSRSATSYYLGFNSNLFRCYNSTSYKLYLYKLN